MKRILPILLVLLLLPMLGVRADGGQPIQTGDKGEDVVRIQTRLFDLGYYTYKPTGSFQTVTRSAVLSYQSASGLMSDGSVGSETMQALFSRRAKRVPFHSEVPLSYTAQGPIIQKGNAIPWKTVRAKLQENTAYRIRNAATGEDAALVFVSGKSHAEMTLPSNASERSVAVEMLTKWLEAANSFYKCAVLLELDGQWVAASIQWDGAEHICLYCKDSLSHVGDYPDVEHASNIKKVTN